MTSVVFQAGYTHGSAGAPSYTWGWVSQNGGVFVNPTNSSSQRIQRAVSFNNSSHDVTFNVAVMDSQGHVSTTAPIRATFEGDNFS